MYIITNTKDRETYTLCVCKTKRGAGRAVRRFRARHKGGTFKVNKIHWYSTLVFCEFVYKLVRRYVNNRYYRMCRKRDRLNRKIANSSPMK